ncbi:MAG: SPASM domain-containing protein [Deltaproteobacteria bacterium]|nr:SPASM domain-containing protein [Deltaproteobacteria bacterium]
MQPEAHALPQNPKLFQTLNELHLFRVLGKTILYNVITMLFYEVTDLVHDLVCSLASSPDTDPLNSLAGRHNKEEILLALAYLEEEGFFGGMPAGVQSRPPPLKKRWGIRHLELMVTHACNMACRYCYGSVGPDQWEGASCLYGATTGGMSFDVAQSGIDFLFEASGPQKELSVVFFGGEPLLELSLIEKIVPYVRRKEEETGKNVDLSLSTNGLLLTDAVVKFLVANKIGCQVSIDGPPELHDANRRLQNGKGSYERILPGIRRLIAARPGRVPARVTVSRGSVDLPRVIDHLLRLGFGSIHIEPVIGVAEDMRITPEDVEAIKRRNEGLAVFLVSEVRKGRYFNYSNLVKFIRQTRVVRERLAHYCGAGRTYFALSQDGDFYPCHRFVGMEAYRMGDPIRGIDETLRRTILDLTVERRPTCKECWARYLCGGGCWKHAVDIHGGLDRPDSQLSCEIIRHQIECAMAINSELNVADQDILSELYEKATEPYLIAEKGGD